MKRYPGIKTLIDKDDIEILKRDRRVIVHWDTFFPYGTMNVYSKVDKPIQEILRELDIKFSGEQSMILNCR